MPRQTLLRRRIVVTTLAASMLMSGCTRTVMHRIARFEPAAGAEETTRAVPEAAMWKVKVRERGEKEYHGVDGTERWLQQGDVVGFRTGEDGVIYAVVNREEIPLQLTSDHRRVAWQSKTKETTNFGEGLNQTLTFTGNVLVVTALGALLLYALAHPSDDDTSN